jgi:N-acetylmuramic acid 6-phosphate etherase
MVLIGKTYGNRMIDLQPTNHKLRLRTRRILRELTGLSDADAGELLARASGRLKTALVSGLAGIEPADAELFLSKQAGNVRAAVRAATGADRL